MLHIFVFILYICVWVYWGDGNKFMYVCYVYTYVCMYVCMYVGLGSGGKV